MHDCTVVDVSFNFPLLVVVDDDVTVVVVVALSHIDISLHSTSITSCATLLMTASTSCDVSLLNAAASLCTLCVY
jgi:hypothetical protein